VQQLAAWLGRGVIDPIQKGLLINQLSKILAVSAEDLHRQLDRMAERTSRPAATTASASVPHGADAAFAEPTSLNAEQKALQQVIEVLLNEPALYPAVEPYFEPTCIQDRTVAAIGVELVGMLRGGEPFEVSELIGRFESPEYGRVITDLAFRGEQRVRYAVTIEGAVACLQTCQQDRQAAAAEEAAGANEDEKLLARADRARNPGFAGLRTRKKFM
jgi:hypothetical protein